MVSVDVKATLKKKEEEKEEEEEVANRTPLWQQGGPGEDGHIHLAHWTFGVAATERKEKRDN